MPRPRGDVCALLFLSCPHFRGSTIEVLRQTNSMSVLGISGPWTKLGRTFSIKFTADSLRFSGLDHRRCWKCRRIKGMKTALQDWLRTRCSFPQRFEVPCVYAGRALGNFFFGNYSLRRSLKQGICRQLLSTANGTAAPIAKAPPATAGASE